MKTILLGWDDDGKWSTTITVEGGRIVRIKKPHRTDTKQNRVIVPSAAEVKRYSKKYAGDMLAAGLSKLGAKPCKGCKKRQQVLNTADKWVRDKIRRRSA